MNLDDKFLEEIGLGTLPEAEKPKMRAHIYETLEMRVGMRLASGMSSQQLNEFESFVSGDIARARDFLGTWKADWEQDTSYQKNIENAKKRVAQQGREFTQADIDSLTSEFAALQWLSSNFPNYKDVVSEELNKLKGEIKAAAPQILAETNS